MNRTELELVQEIKNAAQCYYTGNPIMSDAAFDSLIAELTDINPHNPILHQVGWGYVPPKSKKFEHKHGLIGSLNKVHSISELSNTQQKQRKVASAKLDGSTCVAYYTNGKLDRALSRGDGLIGVEKTAKYVEITRKYNLTIPEDFSGSIRGEIVFSWVKWTEYKKKYPDAKFPRNISTGMFMSDELSEDLQFVEFIAYKIIGSNIQYQSYSDMLYALEHTFNFKVVPYETVNDITDEMCKSYFDKWNEIYPIDGLVFNFGIQYNNTYTFNDIAYKFQAEAKLTTVKDIEWSLTKNNLLVPVLVIDELFLSGAAVKRVTAYNAQYLVDNGIGVDSQIMVQRSGEVIPKVVEVVKSVDVVLPDICPVCGHRLTMNGVHLTCENETCSNNAISKLREWVKLIGCRNLQGVGEVVLDDIIAYYGWKDIYSIYEPIDVTYNELTEHQKQLYQAVYNNLIQIPVTPEEALTAMNIRGIGRENSDKIAKLIYDSPEFNDNLISQLKNINGIGDSVVNLIAAKFDYIRNIFSLEIVKPSQNLNNKVMQGITVVITGAVSLPRKQFESVLSNNGIVLTENINKADILICNSPSNSSKYTTAVKKGIPILTEQEFMKEYIK